MNISWKIGNSVKKTCNSLLKNNVNLKGGEGVCKMSMLEYKGGGPEGRGGWGPGTFKVIDISFYTKLE